MDIVEHIHATGVAEGNSDVLPTVAILRCMLSPMDEDLALGGIDAYEGDLCRKNSFCQ